MESIRSSALRRTGGRDGTLRNDMSFSLARPPLLLLCSSLLPMLCARQARLIAYAMRQRHEKKHVRYNTRTMARLQLQCAKERRGAEAAARRCHPSGPTRPNHSGGLATDISNYTKEAKSRVNGFRTAISCWPIMSKTMSRCAGAASSSGSDYKPSE